MVDDNLLFGKRTQQEMVRDVPVFEAARDPNADIMRAGRLLLDDSFIDRLADKVAERLDARQVAKEVVRSGALGTTLKAQGLWENERFLDGFYEKMRELENARAAEEFEKVSRLVKENARFVREALAELESDS